MNPLTLQIRQEIERHGPISAARFMELALYAPGSGYYEHQTEIGRKGDFFTSVSAGSLFGELLAFQFARWLKPLLPVNMAGIVQIVEAGAHRGFLAADILRWLQTNKPELFASLEYWLVEPSPTRRQWQETTLSAFSEKVHWTDAVSELQGRINGVIFSNELLDAMPFHRLCWDAASRAWLEWKVSLDDSKFVWQTGPLSSELAAFLPTVPPELAAVLPGGFTTEISPAALEWWSQAAHALSHGKLLTIDYGLTAEEFLLPQRSRGTLRAYARHQLRENVLADPGQQDITAHVNFTAIQRAGETAGLKNEAFLSQSRFLTRIFAETLKPEPASRNAEIPAWRATLRRCPLPEEPSGNRRSDYLQGGQPWTPSQLRQFHTLTHPEHLGRSFFALVQARD